MKTPPTLVVTLDNYDFDLLRRGTPGREYQRITQVAQIIGRRRCVVFSPPGGSASFRTPTEWYDALTIMQAAEIHLCRITRELLESAELAAWMELQEQRHAQKFSPPAIGEMCLCESPAVSVVMPALAGFDSAPVCSACRRPHVARFRFRTR
jgi:hypothetical protein